MKRLLLFILVIAALGAGYLYLFPEVEILSDHCIACDRTRVYDHLAGDKYGSTIYNLQVERPGNTSPTHRHVYVDPQISDTRALPRWSLRASGTQAQ
jgi:hypothetical protein